MDRWVSGFAPVPEQSVMVGEYGTLWMLCSFDQATPAWQRRTRIRHGAREVVKTHFDYIFKPDGAIGQAYVFSAERPRAWDHFPLMV